MTNKTINLALVAILLTSLLFLSSCEKWRDNKETITTIDHEVAASTYMDMYSLVLRQTFDLGDSLTGLSGIPVDCYTLTKSGTTFPKTITLTFPDTNCTELYNISHSGVLSITFDKPFNQVGAIATLEGANFTVENFSVEGIMKVTALGNKDYALNVTNGVVTSTTTNDVVNINADWKFMLSDPQNPVFFYDDYYAVSGTASGTNREGKAFTSSITENLVRQVNCRWPQSGKMEIEITDLKTREVDFGSTNCDNIAIVKIGKKKKENDTNLK